MSLGPVPDKRQPVLACVLEYGEFPEVLRVADDLRAMTGREVLVMFTIPDYRELERDTKQVLAHGHRWVDWMGTIHTQPARSTDGGQPAAGQPGRSGVLRRVIEQSGLDDIARGVLYYRRLRTRYRQIEGVLRAFDPALVVVGQDTLGRELSFILIAARRAGIPTLIVPFAMFTSRELVVFACGRPDHRVDAFLLNRLLARFYPQWVTRDGNDGYVRLRGHHALPVMLLGLMKGDPWAPCSEPVTAIACESAVSAKTMTDMGIPAERLVVVGAPVHDRLARAIEKPEERDGLLRRHNLAPDRPLVLVGWPANIFSWLGERRIDYPDYSSLAKAWADILAAARDLCGVNILVSVHPKTSEEEISAALEAGFACQRGATDALVPHCDLFVTLNGSSITAWAIACAKPVLLFDCYDTGYTDFDDVPGCIMTHDAAAFARELARLCGDADAREAVARSQAAAASAWGVLDGRAGERLKELVLSLTAAGARSESGSGATGELARG